MIVSILLFTALAADTVGGTPMRDGCGEDAAIVATIVASDQVAVQHGVAGEALPCYAVSIVRSGGEVRGYVLETSLAAVQEFERLRALESRIPIPAVPIPPAAASTEKKAVDRTLSTEEAGPLAGRQFPSWNGVDWKGKSVSIRPDDAKLTLVAFVSPKSKAGRFEIVDLSILTSRFSAQGLKSVGFIEGASVFDTKTYMEDLLVNFPLAADNASLASQFGANQLLLLDKSGKVVASGTDVKRIQTVVGKLLTP
jgi:hypothetical protein